MKKDIKPEILAAARALFAERGLDKVSLRDVADKLGISVGNLTYHYRRKEQLIEAVVEKQHENYRRPPPPATLEALDAYFRNIIRHQQQNTYYFNNYAQLAQMSPRVRRIQAEVIADNRAIFQESFEILRQKGLMQPPQLPNQWEYLTQAILLIRTEGVYHFYAHYPQDPEGARLACLWNLLYAFLTEAGREVYKTLRESP